MHIGTILAVYFKELKDTLRDRRTLVSIIVIPSLAIPLLSLTGGSVARKVVKSAMEETPTVAVIGGESAPAVMNVLKGSDSIGLVPVPADWKSALAEKKLRAVVKLPDGFETDLKANRPQAIMVYKYSGEMKSEMGAKRIESLLDGFRERVVEERLAAKNLPRSFTNPFVVRCENVAPPEKVGGNVFGGIIPYIIILACFSGAMYPAIDVAAGEKERGTMETLLCSSATRHEIVVGKFLMVLTGSLTSVCCMLISLGGTLATVRDRLQEYLPGFDPVGFIGVAALVLPVAGLISAMSLAIAVFAKTQKEAQTYLAPLALAVIMPAMLGMLPGMELDTIQAFVPLLNVSLACKEMLSGVWHWDLLAIIFGSYCLYASAMLALAIRMFHREEVIFRS